MKIIVVCPTRGIILTEAQSSLDRELAKNRQIPIIIRSHDIPLPASRNYLVETALKMPDWTHILLVDDDVILPEGALKELIKLNCDVAVMNYPARYLGEDASLGTVVYDKDKSVAWAGLGCVLVKRKVFETLAQPWFVFTNYKILRDNEGRIGFFAGQREETLKFSGGEDVHFFLQCRKAKFSIKVAKKTATHCYLERIVSPVSNMRYQMQHKIVKKDKIERQMI